MKSSLAAMLFMLLAAAAASAQSPPAADIMLISAHGDDEGIFGGEVLPYYAQIRGLKVLQLTMTGDGIRIDQLRRAIDVYAGVQAGSIIGNGYYVAGNITLMPGGLADCCGWEGPEASWKEWGNSDSAKGRAAASYIVAREIRRLRPRIVLSAHALSGDYGHSNHKATAVAAYEGVVRAADSNEQIEGLAPYEVEKLFLRGTREENTTTLDGLPTTGGLQPFFHDHWERRLFNGSSARQVTNLGLKQHWTEYYLEPQAATVFCDSIADTNQNPLDSWEFIRQGHASEVWVLFRSKGGRILPQSTFTINGVEYTNWARGDFWDTPVDFMERESAPPSSPVSTDVSVVNFREGSLENIGCRLWQQFDAGSNSPSRQYVEEYPLGEQYKGGRYLVLKDAPNSRLLIDLDARTVRKATDTFDPMKTEEWKDSTLPRFDQTLYQITGLDKRVSGRNVRAVFFREGQSLRRDTTASGWEETDVTGSVIYRFRETSRDTWSVYLSDDSRGVRLQIDTHRGWIRFADRARPEYTDQYKIVTAR
jgi:LmbE family N-acetylglucosaminyl deacetylase